jgi:zinc-ribbon domain
MTPCPQCGTEPPDGALFCPSCGARMSVRPEAVASQPAWDTDRPAIPDDLFRVPVEEPLATPDDELFRPPSTGADSEATAVRPVPLPTMASPAWTYRPGTPEADLLPSERPYLLPPPPVARPAHGNFSGSRGVVILLAILVIAAIAGGVLWFTGGGSPSTGPRPTTSASATASASGGKASGTPSKVQSATVTPSATPSDAFPPSGAALCSGSTTVAVNATTSCPFALNVAAAIPAGSTGSFAVTANSPATNKDYQMACVRGTYTVCTGGVNALVYVK